MDKYTIILYLNSLRPFIVVLISVVAGVMIANSFWKARIHRYATAEVQQIMAFQDKEITLLKEKLKNLESEMAKKEAMLKSIKASGANILKVANG